LERTADYRSAALYLRFARYLLIARSPRIFAETLQSLERQAGSPPWTASSPSIQHRNELLAGESLQPLRISHSTLSTLIDLRASTDASPPKKLYRAGGFVIHHNTDIWGDTVPIRFPRVRVCGRWAAAWLSLHLWITTTITGDRVFNGESGLPRHEKKPPCFCLNLTETGRGT